jgi:hypothetical protein
MALVRWPEIELFHAVRRTVAAVPTILAGRPTVTYRGKVKLHGTNAAVQVLPGGVVEAQSRTAVLTPTSDNAGFARWVQTQVERWQAACPATTVLYGEWCGPGIQRGVAVNALPHKVFAVFAAGIADGDALVVEPSELEPLVRGLEGVHVLPWQGEPIEVDWSRSSEELSSITALINAAVESVERCDPWVQKTFGVEGVGEGLVYYPVSHPGREAFAHLVFKAKGEQHRVVRSKEAAQADPELARCAADFAELVLPEPRLEQGARAVTPEGGPDFESKRIGAFLAWITQDVTKETAAELEASGLSWPQVQRAVTDRARRWYLARLASG